jgi:hypothetical protein
MNYISDFHFSKRSTLWPPSHDTWAYIYLCTHYHLKERLPSMEKCIRCEVMWSARFSTISQRTGMTHSWTNLSDGGIKFQHSNNRIYLNYYSRYHTHRYFQFSTHDTLLELHSWSTLKVKSLEIQIIASLIYIWKCTNMTLFMVIFSL